MSNRIVKHSNRYKGPMGDCRAPAEIFAGIEARNAQAQEYKTRLINVMDDIMNNAMLMSFECRAEMIKETAIDWLFKNHPDFMEK